MGRMTSSRSRGMMGVCGAPVALVGLYYSSMLEGYGRTGVGH